MIDLNYATLGSVWALILLSVLPVRAQESMDLNRAIALALDQNHQIKILENQVEIAERSASIGNAGLLPSLSAGGSVGGSVNNTELEFAGGIPPNKTDGAQSSIVQGNASLNYVLFNGLRGQRSYQRLKLNKEAVDLQSRANIESVILQVTQMYYTAVRAKDQWEIAKRNAAISARRFERASVAEELGSISKQAWLSARVDLTTDSAAYFNAALDYRSSLRNLGRLIGMPLDTTVQIEPLTLEVKDWSLEQLQQTAMEQNALVKNLELQQAIAEKDVQISWSSVFPTVSLSGGYNYTNQQNEVGILLRNVQSGWTGNLGISYTLFDGLRNNIQRQNAQVILENAELQWADQRLQLSIDLDNAYDAYLQSMRLAEFEEQNLASSELSLSRAEDLMQHGQMTSTEFREAQLALLSAQVRLSNTKVATKLNELEVLRLTGQILSTE